MKRTLLFLILLLMLPLAVNAASKNQINGICYYLDSDTKTAEVANQLTGNKYSGDVVIPPSVTYEGVEYSVTGISSIAFSESPDLISVTIPHSVTIVKEFAFYHCTNLQNIYCYAEQVPETHGYSFQSSNYTNATLHVPAASVSAYQAVQPWKDFKKITALPQVYFPEGTKWTEIRLDTLKYDHWYSKVGDEWVPNFETIEYYVKGEYTTKYGEKYKCIYTNGPEWRDSLTLGIQDGELIQYNEDDEIIVTAFGRYGDGAYGPYGWAPAYQFYWSIGKGIYFKDLLMSMTTYLVQYECYYGIINEIKEKSFGGVRPLKYVDLDGKAPECGEWDNPQKVDTQGGRIIQGIGITEWNDGECLFGAPRPYGVQEGSDEERHYRSMLVHFERDGEVLYDVWPDKLPPIEINEQNFPDEDFRKWVLNQKFGKDGKLTREEISEVTFMNLFPQNITAEGHIKSLKGIEYFTAVEKLICSRNELTELDLSKNTALTWLECYGNHLTELDLSKNTELTKLDCNSNELTALDMSCCNKLTELNCSFNKLTTLNVSGCSVLTILRCYRNQLTVINLSGCTSLATMWTFENQLSALNVLDCTSLSILWCEDNQLTQLDVSNNTALKELRCFNNQLTKLYASNNTELRELWCNENQLTALDLSKNKMLTSLRSYHNPIKGKAMDALIESLPIVSSGGWCCVLSEDEEGVVTTTQAAAAKAKGWIPYYWNEADKKWMEYAGSETTQNEYRPFVEEGKVWKVGSTLITDSLVKMVDYYYFEGDTIVDGKTCKQMMCQRFVSPDYPGYDIILQYNMLNYVGAWYEEDKKVYAYDSISNQFELMYDFSVNANDTLQIKGQSYVIGPRQTGGIKGFKGVYRDVWECGDEERIYFQCAPWLEGVGVVYGPPTTNIFSVELEDPAWFLMSCAVGDEVIYLNDEYEDGIIPEGVNAPKRRFDFTHTTKSQPKSPMRREAEQSLYGEYNNLLLDINLDPLSEAYLVRITDETGKVVYEKAINAGSIVALNIDISAYAAGRYTVTVENSQETFTGEFETQTTGIRDALRLNNNEEIKNKIYNLQGQRLSTLQRGLNIVNGKKVYVK